MNTIYHITACMHISQGTFDSVIKNRNLLIELIGS